eukprot:scaffold8968_cov57-Phaeocystis_antarctica.AAC.3
MYCRMIASIITGAARCTTHTSGCGTSRMWLSARPFSLNRRNQWLEMALSAAPLPATPSSPPSPRQMHSYAEIRSLITITASSASGATSYLRLSISRLLSAAVSQ